MRGGKKEKQWNLCMKWMQKDDLLRFLVQLTKYAVPLNLVLLQNITYRKLEKGLRSLYYAEKSTQNAQCTPCRKQVVFGSCVPRPPKDEESQGLRH